MFYSGAPLASDVDWTKVDGVLAAVQDQGQCGSCWAFSATCALESGYGLHVKKAVEKLSEQELVDCETTDMGCNGGLMDHAFAWAEKHGMTTESKIPYTAEDGSCTYKTSEEVMKNSGYTDVDPTDAAIKEALAGRPLAIGVAANDAWQL